jgi:serine/threonine protein kinase
MQRPEIFCDECGAANSPDATVCFACQSQLEDAPLALAAPIPMVPTPTPVFQLQLNLATGSLTTIPLLPVQATLNLLHGRYQLLEKVGTGGFGAVYKARDMQRRDHLVAIKAIELDALSAAQAIEATDTFHRELSLLSDLNHPSLPRIHAHFTDTNHWYLVMDFIHGEPLDEYVRQIPDARLPAPEVIEIGLQICAVLHYLHQLDPPIIFRDIKPENIMRTPGGRLYLIDFGIARRFKPGQAKDTTPLGSPGFAAPEQYGKAQTTTRTDLYGLGATLYSLLTGYDLTTTSFHLPPILSLCPTLPIPLAELITSMLELDPENRPASSLTVQTTLKATLPAARQVMLSQSMRSTTSDHRQAAQPMSRPSRFSWLSNFLKALFPTLLMLVFL